MISGTRRAQHGLVRDAFGDDAGCRRGSRQREPRPEQRRKLRGSAAEAAHRRGVRLLRLVYVVGVTGIGLVVVHVTSSSTVAVYWNGTPTTLTALKAESARTKRKTGVLITEEGLDYGNRQGKGRNHSVAVGESSGGWQRRRLVGTSDVLEKRDVLEELTEEEDAAAAATAKTCAENSFSGGGAGKVVLLVIAILFTFNGLAIVCDEFFQASLEKISEVSLRTAVVQSAYLDRYTLSTHNVHS